MKIAFQTLGCPQWDLDTICRRGREYGFDGVDFRGYLDTIDETLLPEFSSQGEATRRQLADAGLEVSGLSSSINICVADRMEANLEEARRIIATAQALNCENVRVFGGGDVKEVGWEDLALTGQECIWQILELDGARGLRWLLETHDTWIRGRDCRLLLEGVEDPAVGALWDMGHTFRVGGESPQTTYQELFGRIGYTHVKDAVYDPQHALAMADGWHYVLPGTGSLPLSESIALLKADGYAGWLTFEHEKRWHPNLIEPEIAFPAYAAWAREQIRLD
jgi:sugar phosphate isomerase/epimerase